MQTQKTKIDSNYERIRLFYTGRGKGLRSSVSKDAIPADQRRDTVQAPWSHGRVGKNTTTEFTTVKRNMELIPILGNFIQ